MNEKIKRLSLLFMSMQGKTQTILQPSSYLSAFAPLLEGYEVNTSMVWN